jgi:hypothetical protein
MTTTTFALVVVRKYDDGQAFATVECQTCLHVLNSGYQYLARYMSDAISLRDDHNRTYHAWYSARARSAARNAGQQ